MKTLEAYLRDAFDGKSTKRQAIDHSIRANVEADGSVTFYIHPSGVAGETLNFVVSGNLLAQDPKVTYPNE